MSTNLHKIFTIKTKDINQAAIIKADGRFTVETYRQPAGRRALFEFPDTPETRELIEAYERREALPIPAKAILNARTELYHAAARAIREAL